MTQPLKEYLKNKEARTNLAWHFNGNTEQSGYILSNGVLMSEDTIHEMYPLGSKITLWNYNQKGDNPDRTRII